MQKNILPQHLFSNFKINPLTNNEIFIFFNGVNGLLILGGICAVLLNEEVTKNLQVLCYLLIFTIGSIFSFLNYQLIKNESVNNNNLLEICYFNQIIFLLGIFITFSITKSFPGKIYPQIYSLYLIANFIIIISHKCISSWDSYFPKKFLERLNLTGSIFLPFLICIWSLGWNDDARSYSLNYWHAATSFKLSVICGLLLACYILLRPKFIINSSKQASWIVLALISILLFDAKLHFDPLHYGTYIGPANAVMGGKIPLVDVQCQYGLSYLLFSGFFSTILPRSYVGAAAITSAINVLYFFTFLMILRKIIPNAKYVYIIGSLCIFSIHHLFPYAYNLTPSIFGSRFLPPLILGYALICLPRSKYFTVASLAALSLCLIWSLESAIYGSATYFATIIINLIFYRAKPKIFIKFSILFLCYICLFYVALSLLLKYLSGGWPRYDFYFDLMFGYLDKNTPWGAVWQVLIDKDFIGWLPVFVVYFGYSVWIIKALYEGISEKNNESLNSKIIWIFPILFIGIAESSVYIYRSIWTLTLGILPPVLLLISQLIYQLLFSQKKGLIFESKVSASTISAALIFILFVPIMTGIMFGPLFYRKEAGFLRQPQEASRSPSLIYQWLDNKNPIRDVYKRLKAPDKVMPLGFASMHRTRTARFDEAVTKVNQYASNEKDVLLFMPETTHVLFFTNKIDLLPISYSVSEEGSPKLWDYFSNYTPKIESGRKMILAKHIEEMEPLDRQMIRQILKTWDAELIDDAGYFTQVYKLVPKGTSSSTKILRLPIESPSIESSSDLNTLHSSIKLTDDWVATSWKSQIASEIREETVTLDLGAPIEINKIKLIPIPEYPNLFPSKFTIEVSNNKINWLPIASEKSFNPADFADPGHQIQGVYEKQFPTKVARWVRLRALNMVLPDQSGYSLQIGDIMIFKP